LLRLPVGLAALMRSCLTRRRFPPPLGDMAMPRNGPDLGPSHNGAEFLQFLELLNQLANVFNGRMAKNLSDHYPTPLMMISLENAPQNPFPTTALAPPLSALQKYALIQPPRHVNFLQYQIAQRHPPLDKPPQNSARRLLSSPDRSQSSRASSEAARGSAPRVR